MGRPAPAQLYGADALQAAYESGYTQMYDHDSFGFTDCLDAIVDWHADTETWSGEAELRAAAVEGAADALRALAARMWEGARCD
jgi:hypothetical protein